MKNTKYSSIIMAKIKENNREIQGFKHFSSFFHIFLKLRVAFLFYLLYNQSCVEKDAIK